jgi:DNA polymerase I-like protein with 3'-5' exonuclease and polymerase domains
LLKHGWEPTEWNYVKEKDGTYRRSSPKLTEDSFGSINGDVPAKIKERLLVAHRASTLMSMKDKEKGWIPSVRSDGTLPASANPCGTNTCRMTHSVVVNVPKASSRVPYGKEMRSLFIPRPGRVMVGHDAEQLELRMLAHYMNDYLYTQELLNGDIHSYNQKLAGLSTRDEAKTFIYAFIYGAGDEKLGNIVGGGKREGSEIRRRFMLENPNLSRLIDKTKLEAKKGYLVGLDGRKIWMRKDELGNILTHKALNTKLQSAGAIVMKRAMVILATCVVANHLDSIKIIDMHDESQSDVAPESVEEYMEPAKASIVKAGEYYNLNIPLSASVKKGNNWSETH